MKKVVLFCMGLSGSGKSTFINKYMSGDAFYKLKSVTTRPMRPGEQDGVDYYFLSESAFNDVDLATRLWVNQDFWTPGKPKWMYGVPSFEIYENRDKNLVYDVIQPKYARQMIQWFSDNYMADKYDFKTIYFIPPTNSTQIVSNRANMPDDTQVRQKNTCDPIDFLRAGLNIDFMVKFSAEETIVPRPLISYLNKLGDMKNKSR